MYFKIRFRRLVLWRVAVGYSCFQWIIWHSLVERKARERRLISLGEEKRTDQDGGQPRGRSRVCSAQLPPALLPGPALGDWPVPGWGFPTRKQQWFIIFSPCLPFLTSLLSILCLSPWYLRCIYHNSLQVIHSCIPDAPRVPHHAHSLPPVTKHARQCTKQGLWLNGVHCWIWFTWKENV